MLIHILKSNIQLPTLGKTSGHQCITVPPNHVPGILGPMQGSSLVCGLVLDKSEGFLHVSFHLQGKRDWKHAPPQKIVCTVIIQGRKVELLQA